MHLSCISLNNYYFGFRGDGKPSKKQNFVEKIEISEKEKP